MKEILLRVESDIVMTSFRGDIGLSAGLGWGIGDSVCLFSSLTPFL